RHVARGPRTVVRDGDRVAGDLPGADRGVVGHLGHGDVWLLDDRAGLDAAVLVLVAAPIQVLRAHVPRRARDGRRNDGRVRRSHPVVGLGYVGAPREQGGRPTCGERHRDVGAAVVAGRARVAGHGQTVDRAAVDSQVAADPREGLRAGAGLARFRGGARCERIALERGGVRRGQAGAQRRNGAAARTAQVGVLGVVPRRKEVVRLVTTGREVVVQVDRVLAGRETFDREPERHHVALVVGGVVLVQVAVLPTLTGLVRPLVEVDVERRQ